MRTTVSFPAGVAPLRGAVAVVWAAVAMVWPAPVAPPRESQAPSAPAPAPAARYVRPLAAAPAPPPAPAAVARTAGPVAARPLAADEAEVCGLGIVRVDDDTPRAADRIPDGVRALALQRLGLAMATSADERLRAAAMLLRVRLAVAPGTLAGAADADAACRRARDLGLEETARYCIDDQTRQQAALLAPAAPAIDELARLAALSSDPQVYAFAFEACSAGGLSFHRREGNCQLISAEQWARHAPDDAEPWLQVAAESLSHGDAAAADAALARAAAARAIGAQAGTLPALATAALGADTPLLEQTAVMSELAGIAAGGASPGLAVVDSVCAAAELQDPARRSRCDALATMLVERGRGSAAVTAGVQLGERLGWPAERTAAILRELRSALDAALSFVAAPQALACDSLQRTRELALLTGRLGELEAGRELQRRQAGARTATRSE